jgi:flagellar biosynthetic protein FliR
MDIQFGYYPQLFLLVLTRIAAIVGGLMIFGKGRVPPRIRSALILALAFMFTPLLSAEWVQVGAGITNLFELTLAVLNEVLLGLVLALVCDIIFMLCQMAGFIIGFGASLTMAQAIDPTSGTSGEILGSILQLTCFMVLILNDAHLVVIKLLFQSFSVLPHNPAEWFSQNLLSDVVMLLTKAYEWGVRLAAPAIAIGFLLDLSFGLIAKMAPDFDILFLSLPIRLFLGIAIIGYILHYSGPFFDSVTELFLSACKRILIA